MSEEVKRWSVTCASSFESGDYVLYSDYQTLLSRNAELEREVKELREDKERVSYLGGLEKARMIAQENVTRFLVLASDGYTCWGKTFREAVDNAMHYDGVRTALKESKR